MKFKVGDRVTIFGDPRVYEVTDVLKSGYALYHSDLIDDVKIVDESDVRAADEE